MATAGRAVKLHQFAGSERRELLAISAPLWHGWHAARPIMDFRKTYFLLPNLFTLSGLFCGFYAIAVCARLNDEGGGSDALDKASLAIFIGMFFDTADGRIARLTKTQSELGLHLDSLADVVTFGVAPAFVVYRWGLEGLGQLGLFVAFLFVACGALRLARFNVLSLRAKHEDPEKIGKYMLGLPIPVAAGVIISLIMAFHAIGISQTTNHLLVGAMIVVLSYLMVSRVRFRSMKDLRLTKRTLAVVALLIMSAIVVAVRISQPAVLIMLVSCYIVLGLVEETLLVRKSRREARLARAQAAQAELAGPVDDEREVLAELGVEDEPARVST
jgi:CDP-diacylglycerol--serine O-phosphatidyltransferase